MGLCSSLLVLVTLLPGQAQPSTTEIYHDFRGSRPLPSSLNLFGTDAAAVIKAEPEGLRITPPTDGKQTYGWGVATGFSLSGDFELTATYELLAAEPPLRGGGVGVALNLEPDAARKKFAKVGRFLHIREGNVYVAEYWTRHPPPVQEFRSLPTGTRAGQLRLTRRGATLHFLVADHAGDEFQEVHQTEFGTEELARVRFVVNNNSSPTRVEARLIDLKIRSAGPLPVQAPDTAKGDGPKGGSAGAKLLGLVLAPAVAVALALGGWLCVCRRRAGKVAARAAVQGKQAPPEAAAALGSFSCPDCGKSVKAKAELAGKEVKCPQCGQEVLVPAAGPSAPSPLPVGGLPLPAVLVVVAFIYGCSIYANLSFTVAHPAEYRFFPPFEPYVNENMNRHLGGEYFNIARSLAAGEGFAHPFGRPTGPTAWMPPILPAIQAAFLWASGGSREGAMAIVVFLQVFILLGTGLLVLALARQTTRWVGTGVATAIFLAALLCHFHLCFQFTHDCWLVLLAINLLIAVSCWWQPLQSGRTAAGWGLFGGFCALINPIVGLVWGVLSLLLALRQRTWFPLATAVLCAGLTLLPWTVRNYLVFGRWIPVKSNLAYELYQTQCLQSDGLLQGTTFPLHPYHPNTPEGREYQRLGEVAYLEQKREQFGQAVGSDPPDFIERIGRRFLGATLWYVPFYWDKEAKRPWVLWLSRLTHPLPFLALLVLLGTAVRERLHWAQWVVMGVYVFYLLPYIGVSYYERYALPLLGAKLLLVIWAVDRLLALRPLTPSRAYDRCESPSQPDSGNARQRDRFLGAAGTVR